MNENKTISGDDVLEMSRQQFSNETYSEFLRGRKQGALEELKNQLKNLNEWIEQFNLRKLHAETQTLILVRNDLKKRIKELEGKE